MDRMLFCISILVTFLSGAHFASGQDEKAPPSPIAALREALKVQVEKDKSSSWDITKPSDELKTREDFQKKLTELNDSHNGNEYLRHGIEYLLRFEPGDDFTEILWRTAAYSELAERDGAPVLQTKLTPFLIKQLSSLPEDDEFYLEGRFLAATHHSHQQEYAEEEEILRSILAREELKRDFRFSAIERMGYNFELRERYREAMDWYLKSEEYLEEFPSAYDALLRAVFIYLETDKRDEAFALLDRIRATDREKWSKSISAAQLGGLLAMTEDRAKAEAYWKSSAVWWAVWTGLRDEMGYRSGTPDVRVAVVPNPQRLAQELAMAARAGRSAMFLDHLDLLARCLKWMPQYVNDFGSALCFLSVRMFPGNADDMRSLMLNVADHFETDDAELKRFIALYRALCLIDTGRPDEALKAIAAFKANDHRDDPISQGMNRLWAAVAYTKGEKMEEPAQALEAMLDDPDAINRIQTVLALSSLYRKMGRVEDEKILLKREMAHPSVSENEAARRLLESRYNPIVQEGEDAANFAVAVGDWLTKFKPAWFDVCPPRSLDDPRLGDLEKVLREGGAFSDEEMIKIRLLAASADGVPLVLKQIAFRHAMTELSLDATTHAEFRKMVTAVIDNDLFSEEIRRATLLLGIEQAVEHRQRGDLAFYMTHPVMDQGDERIKAAMEIYGPYSQCDQNSADELFALQEKFTKGVIERPQLAVIFSILARLLDLGALDKADAIYEKAGTWELAPNVQQSVTELKMLLLRSIKQARRSVPFSEAMISLVKEHFDLDAVEEPGVFSSLRDLRNVDRLPRAVKQQLRLWQIKSGQFPRSDPRFWLDFADSLEQNEKSFAFCFAMLEKLLAEADGDMEKSLGAMASPGFIDTDEPKLVERLAEVFAPYRDGEKFPLTYAAIRFLEIQTDLRHGKEVDLNALDELEHPALGRTGQRLKIRENMVEGNKAMLKTVLEGIPADVLLAPSMLSLSIPAFDAAGMKEEAELARETAASRFPVMLASAWRRMYVGDVNTVYEIAALLNKPELIPAEFFTTLSAAIRDEQHNLTLRMRHAELNSDWKELEKVATEAVASFPTFYHFYWYQAEARYRLEKKKEALVPLEIYTKYSKDEEEYPTALKWLQEIKSGE